MDPPPITPYSEACPLRLLSFLHPRPELASPPLTGRPPRPRACAEGAGQTVPTHQYSSQTEKVQNCAIKGKHIFFPSVERKSFIFIALGNLYRALG